MNTAKRLAMAAGAFLQYEFACQRDTLFNERSLVTPISNVLKAVYKHEVHTEFLHPVLAPLKSGPGRRPEVDFAVVQRYPEIICAVETKWVGAGGIKMEDLLWDVLRLELIAHSAKADAYFVLAGRRRHLSDFLGSKAFVGQVRSKGKVRTILKMRPQPRIRITAPLSERKGLFQKVLAEYQDLSFPVELSTTVGQMYPETCPTFQYQAYAWQIHFPPSMRRFYPRDNKLYRLPQATRLSPPAPATGPAVS
jgi:hypothetical protein